VPPLRLNRKQAFGIAGIIAIIAAVLVYVVITSQNRTATTQAPQKTSVVVASTNIPAYTRITPGMVEVKEVAINTAPSNAITQSAQVVGQIAQYAITSGQLLVRGDVVEAGPSQGLTFVIPKGRRAVTVALDAISGVGGFVQPGDRVDVLATFDSDEMTVTKMIMQNTEVLAMNTQTGRPKAGNSEASGDSGAARDAESPVTEAVKNATLAVTPDEAQRIILAAYKGSLHMVLRSREDPNGVHLMIATTDWQLMGIEPPCPVDETEEEQGMYPPPVNAWQMGYAGPPAPTGPATAAPAATPAVDEGIVILRGSAREVVTPTQ